VPIINSARNKPKNPSIKSEPHSFVLWLLSLLNMVDSGTPQQSSLSLSDTPFFGTHDRGQHRWDGLSLLAHLPKLFCLSLEPVSPTSSQSFREKDLSQNRSNGLGEWDIPN